MRFPLCRDEVLVGDRLALRIRTDGDHQIQALGLRTRGVREGHGRCEPEVDRNGDRAERVGGEHGFEVLGAVEHQDDDAVPEADAVPRQRVGEFVHSLVEARPGDRFTLESQRGALRDHQGVPGNLVVPVVSAEAQGLRACGGSGRRAATRLRCPGGPRSA